MSTYGPYGSPPRNTEISDRELDRRTKAENDRIDAAIAARQARTAELAAERERAQREQAQQELAAFEAESKQATLAAGGSYADFAKLWPEMRQDFLKRRALEGMDAEERRAEEIYQKMRQAGGFMRL